MKLIDKTPWQDDKGEISLVGRIQGTFKYGMNWYAEMEAQKEVVALLDRSLEKGFVLLRNLTLPNSTITIPIALIGVGGIQVIYVTPAKGQFEAKGDQWNTIDKSGNSQPAGENLLDRTSKLARVFQKFLENQKVSLPNPVEPVLISVNPGAHIESMRPIIKVVKSDAVKPYIASLLQATPIWRPEFIYALADRLADPKLGEPQAPEQPASTEVKSTPRDYEKPAPPRQTDFDDGYESKPFDSNEFSSLLEEDEPAPTSASAPAERPAPSARAARPRPKAKAAPAQGRILGMTKTQVMILAGFLVFWLCVIGALGTFILLNPQ
jgi:hypothetical protein